MVACWSSPESTSASSPVPPALPAGPDSAARAAEVLRAGGLVIFPTETVYGLGCDIGNDLAVRELFRLKGRDGRLPLMAHCGDISQLAVLVDEVPIFARRLIHRYWPGPLALVMRKHPAVSDVVTAGRRTIGIRMVADPCTCLLIANLGAPLAGTSANLHRAPATNDFSRLDPALLAGVGAALDAGVTGSGQASTVLDVTVDPPALLRAGAVSAEEIEAAIGRPVRHAPAAEPGPPRQ